ncbi:CDP-alcohol phosphatidyltransferase family protein [Alicyclobacillus herbarius]|uniref:CDP-alcohol phosphatidyltransferase family protein n=1 Tax=Alicyclobacillus herbarius TaxID=122960 RepID=UPI0003F6BDAA|nr:CDP-alcohol phosphatidyltransferase family protein [Alicyclobacillus herbarius]
MTTLTEVNRCAKRPVDVWTNYLYYPLSIRLVWLVQRWPRITPNTLTLASLGLCVIGCLGLASNTPNYFLAGLLLVEAAYVVDCADGQLARLRQQYSAIGGWLDQVADRVKEGAIYLSLADGWMRQHPNSDAWLWAMVALFSLYLLEYLGQIPMFRNPGSKEPLVPTGQPGDVPFDGHARPHPDAVARPVDLWTRAQRLRRYLPFSAYNIGEQYFALLVFGALGAVHPFLCFSAVFGLAMCVYRPIITAIKFQRARNLPTAEAGGERE